MAWGFAEEGAAGRELARLLLQLRDQSGHRQGVVARGLLALAAQGLQPALDTVSARLQQQSSDRGPGAAMSALSRLAAVRGAVASVVAITSAAASAGLAAALFGQTDAGTDATVHPALAGVASSGSDGLRGNPLPWLAAAAEASNRWPALLQRLAAHAAPELVAQLWAPVAAGGSGGAMSAAAADLAAVVGPVEAAVRAGRDAQVRLAALAELVATYQQRAAELAGRLANPALVPAEAVVMQEELRALEGAWASRDAVSQELRAAAAAAGDALAAALVRVYEALVGAGVTSRAHLPPELASYTSATGQPPHQLLLMRYQQVDREAAAAAVRFGGAAAAGEGWGGAGGVGGAHAAVSALAVWWAAVAEAVEAVGQGAGEVQGEQDELPAPMRRLWRCVAFARKLPALLDECRAIRPGAAAGGGVAGGDSALSEVYGSVLKLLAGEAASQLGARMEACVLPVLQALRDKIAAVAEGREVGGGAEALGAGQEITGQEPEVAAAELVPFTGFDPSLAGEGELLGGLEEEEEDMLDTGGGAGGGDGDDEAGDGGGGGWRSYQGGSAGDLLGMGAGDGVGGDDDFGDVDLGLDLDLDDGFGGDGGDVGVSGGGLQLPAAAAAAPVVSWQQLAATAQQLAVAAARAAAASTTPSPDATAATPAAASPTPWVTGPEARHLRSLRLQRLAAYEWTHEHQLLLAQPNAQQQQQQASGSPGAGAAPAATSGALVDPHVGGALAQFLSRAVDPLQPSARVAASSRLQLLTMLQVRPRGDELLPSSLCCTACTHLQAR